MSTYVNFQSIDGVDEAHVSSQEEFEIWLTDNIIGRGDKIYVCLPGDNASDAFITTDPTQIEAFFACVNYHDKFFIQEFEGGDYADALGYLVDLFEAKEPFDPKINNN